MIYFKLRTGEQKILSIPGTFARQADTGADLDQAMANPIIDPIGLNIRIASQNPCFVVEKTWYSAEQLASQNHDSFIVGGLTCCAAVLSYDGASNLVNVGHAQGGFINDSQLAYIKSLCDCGSIQHIIYATPILSTSGAGADEGYKDEISRLVNAAGNSRIYIIDGFGRGVGSIEGTVYGDMMGNICFR